MKFSLSSRQSPEYLQKADEIKVQWRDRDIIHDLIEKYPKATINLTRYYQDGEQEIDWNELNTFNVLAQGRLVLGLTFISEMIEARSRGYKFYYLSHIRTYQELIDVINFGVCRVHLGAPLFFEMERVKRVCDLPIVAIANSAFSDSVFTRPDGVLGIWIRPEDVDVYSTYIDTIEFFGSKSQEQALYRIYAEQKSWSGELGLIIQDLNYPCVNRMVPPTLAEARLNCGQRCQENGHCHLCYRLFDLANPDKLRQYLDTTK